MKRDARFLKRLRESGWLPSLDMEFDPPELKDLAVELHEAVNTLKAIDQKIIALADLEDDPD